MNEMVLLGDEAIALGAIHAGITAAYAYPGTPSTEITEYLIHYAKSNPALRATWCANEKTAYEAALGVSFAGRRALVSMKHVGLNVAADPFMNSALLEINGGLVVVVADDPGMHSSQNEQDSRYFADFARIVCLEPASQQEAYEMTREAFDLSEKRHIPVMLRLVTRLAHSRAVVCVSEPRPQNPINKTTDINAWILMPMNARPRWNKLIALQQVLQDYTEKCSYNYAKLTENESALGVITTGLAINYFMENIEDFQAAPAHLHIGAYPLPYQKIRDFVAHIGKVVVLEEGYPYLERFLRGILPSAIEILGKESGHVPMSGELTPDNVRPALGLPDNRGFQATDLPLQGRPPLLCKGCPHTDSFDFISHALADYQTKMVASDIGCYTLGALPPYSAIETCVNMGASIGMAKGASEAGIYPTVAVIGDGTFLHSGIPPLIDAVAVNTDMTLVILDNKTTAMTGGQPQLLPSSHLEMIVRGLGVDPAHFHVINAHRRDNATNLEMMRREIEHHGLSVIIAVRECIETVKAASHDKSKATLDEEKNYRRSQ